MSCNCSKYEAALTLIRDGIYDVTDSVIWVEEIEDGKHPRVIAAEALDENEREE